MGLAGSRAFKFSIWASASASASRSPDEEESYLDQPIELDQFEDGGTDDQEATDLVIGDEIDLLAESAGENEPIELDLGTIVSVDDALSETGDDADSSFEVDPAVGLTVPDALTPDDGSEGLEDGSITVDESKFPALEMDDGSEGVAAEREISLGTPSDEARVAMSKQPWPALHSASALEACVALAVSTDAVVAGSSDLLWFRGDESKPLRVAVDGGALSDLALVGADQDIALACTRSGQLFRRARFASQAEQLTRFREQLRGPQGSRPELGFGGELGQANGRVLLWLRDGSALDVLDAGERFERLELDGKVLAMARESATVLLARDRTRTILKLGRNGGGMPLAGAVLGVAQSAAPVLATAGNALCLAERGRALWVSADDGRTFRGVAGSANTTAIAGAVLAGGARFFAAVYRETSDQSDILLIDPERAEAECIAHLDVAGEHTPSDAIERGEWAKVSALCWHPASGRLWATGGFGVMSFDGNG